MSVYQVEEFYVYIEMDESTRSAVEKFIETDDYDYNVNTHTFDECGLTIDDFYSEMCAEDAEMQIKEFIRSL